MQQLQCVVLPNSIEIGKLPLQLLLVLLQPELITVHCNKYTAMQNAVPTQALMQFKFGTPY